MKDQIDAVLSTSPSTRDGRARRASSPLPDRQSAKSAPAGVVDPLTQLARLIAQDESFHATPRSGGRFVRRATLSVHPNEAPSLGGARENIWPGQDDEASPLIGSGISENPAGESYDFDQDGEYDDRDFSDELPNHRRALRMFVAVVGLALIGAASAAGYWLWSDALTSVDKTPATVAAVISNKILPAPPGEDSRSVPNQSGEQSVKGADRVLPTDEEKLPDADPAAAAPQAVRPVGVLYGPAPLQTAGLTSPAAAPGSPSAPVANPPPPSNDMPAAQSVPEAEKPGLADGVKYVVQLSSQRSEAAALATSKALQTKHADLFAGRQPYIRRSDLGERGVYYRVLIGPLSTTGEANQLCGNLKKSGGDCVVQKN
ncbi:MAG: SPOR domain-containing protein [Bradyrhizobiaceae bacterium]|nr:SPOR domain-containing protein [Hyphomicrobiales bacterium]MBV9426625.1 SPOR domain-containing protein [Bradyrhizobiaceae bacterium]